MFGIVVVSSADMPISCGLVLLDGVDEGVGRRVDAEVDDLEAGAAQHHDAEVLADVVQVALDRAHDDLAERLDARGRQDRLDVGHPGLHRAGAGEHLGHEDEVLAELDADEPHPGDQAVVHDLDGRRAGGERLPGQPIDRRVVAVDQRGRDVLHLRAGHREQADQARRARPGAR